jgi:hypothetical protein
MRWRLHPDLPLSVGFGPRTSPPFRRHRRTVDGDAAPVDVVCPREFSKEHSVQSSPDASARPCPKASPAGRPTAASEFEGQPLPRECRSKDEEDPRQYAAVRDRWSAAALVRPPLLWQQGCHHRPEVVAHESRHILWTTTGRSAHRALRNVSGTTRTTATPSPHLVRSHAQVYTHLHAARPSDRRAAEEGTLQ